MVASSLLGRAYGTDRGRIEQAAARRWSLLYSPYRDAIESSRQAKVFARSGAQQQKGKSLWQRSD
jgi:delta-aminolevulinic acid dehydratase/porphobilinogen synthase